jgi:uncharacterized protein YqjF (DUF2071 family)
MGSPAAAIRFLTAEWLDLAMLNYEIDPATLRARIPAGCELDSFAGRTYVSVVGFRFLRTRVLGMPIPFHVNFDEVNLRFYVRRAVAGERRRGVVFVKELVPRRAIAWVARVVYGENYVALPMRHEVTRQAASKPMRAAYRWKRGGRWEGLSVTCSGAPALAPEDAEESFITEHYWGYARQPDGATIEYRVEHPRWRVWRAETAALECDVAALYGPEFVAPLSRAPATAFVADGSPVIVHRGHRLA